MQFRQRLAWACGLVAALMFCVGTANAQATVLPHYGDALHVGVASCAGSTCHGSPEPYPNSNVLQNEYITWEKDDKHSQAYKVLLNERSQRIARNLGLPSAHTAEICLDCHADNPAKNKQGRRFQIADGVGCEACHGGGAATWFGLHVSGVSEHADNIKGGLFPTENPVERASLCLSCHFGDDNKFVTHRIMGAGHPRMSFELDTFTAIQPAHFVKDSDYLKRKAVASGVQTWAIGQAMAMSRNLGQFIDEKRGRDGIFPELVFFDCHACHHPMSNLRWEPRASVGLQPGIPRYNDANLIMLRVLTQQIAPDLAAQLTERGKALHLATTQGYGEMRAAAEALRQVTSQLVTTFANYKFGPEAVKGLLSGVTGMGLSGEYVDYAAAEQATMALGSIVDSLGGLGEEKSKRLNGALESLYKAVENDESYQPKDYRNALKAMQEIVSTL
jgi:hypothetical protein